MASSTSKGETLVRTFTYEGVATEASIGGTPDEFLVPPLPTGRLYNLNQVLLTATIGTVYPWEQGNFLYDKVLNGATPQAWTPNLDAVGKLSVPANFGGTIVGGGGFNKPSDAKTWKDYALPIPSTSAIQPQLGSGLGVGNSLELQLTYIDGGEAEQVVWTGSEKVAGSFEFSGDPIPEKKTAIIETAFMKANVGYAAAIDSSNLTEDLAAHPLTGKGSGPTQSTGGYGDDQCSGEQKGTFVTWTTLRKAKQGDHLSYAGTPSGPGTTGWLVVLALVPA